MSSCEEKDASYPDWTKVRDVQVVVDKESKRGAWL